METETVEKKCFKVVPQLRFKQFTCDYKNNNLKNLIKELNSGISVNSEDYPIQNKIEAGILKTNCISNGRFFENKNKKIVQEEITRAKLNPIKGQIIISRMNTPALVGESGYIDKDYYNLFIPDRLWQTVVDFDKCDSRWLSYFLITDKVRNNLKSIATGTSGTMKNISKPNFLAIKVQIPPKDEQQKIASFLSAVDKKIQQLTRKKELLEIYKKGVTQQLFSQEIRFKDEDGKDFPQWEKKKFNEVFERVTRKNNKKNKNVLTISAQHGLINRLEQYNNSVAAKDLSNYYLLHRNEFAYNKSYSKGYPMGAIKRLKKYDEGVVSTLYICFKTKPSNSVDFFEHYFENGVFNKQLARIAQEGARNHGLLNLSVVEFFKDLIVYVPQKEEQQKIANFLSAIDNKIEAVSQQIDKTQSFKKGLLQQMFV